VSLCLQLAKQQGDFLLVGLHTDEDVEARRGPHTPIMNVHERALSVLACKYVDEVRRAYVLCCAWHMLSVPCFAAEGSLRGCVAPADALC
jgi:cytidyltransferase-like protein